MCLLKHRIHQLCLALVPAAALFASQPSSAEDLQEIYELALARDAVYQSAQASYLAAREATPQARSFLLPQITGFASYTYSQTSITKDQIFGDNNFTTNNPRYGLNLNQVIFNRDLFISLDQAEKSVLQAEAQLEASRQDLILRMATAYFNVLTAEDTLRSVTAAKDAFKRQMDQAQKRFDVGLIAITDVKEAQANYDNSRAAEIQSKNDLAVARSALAVIIGQRFGDLAKMSERVKLLTPEPNDMDEWVDRAWELNLNLIAAKLATENAALEIRRQRSGHWPTIGFTAGANQNNTDRGTFGGRDIGTMDVGVRLDVPIYSGGFVNSRTREAQYSFQQAQDQYIQLRRDTAKDTVDSYLTVMSNISRVQALKQAVVSNQAAYEATQAGFDVGTRTSVDVSQSIRGLFAAERDYFVSRYDYVLATLSLKRATGILSADDVQKINSWLD